MEPKTLGIIISRAPGSGKGRQCEFIKAKYQAIHLSTGDRLRAAVNSGTEIGRKADDINADDLVPDKVMIEVLF